MRADGGHTGLRAVGGTFGVVAYCAPAEGVGTATVAESVRIGGKGSTRVYDSRAAAPTPGLLATGNNHLVSVADGREAAGAVTAANIVAAVATAVAANITITGTTNGFGYLAINPGGNTVEGASTINWSTAGLTTANGVTLTLNTTRQLTVVCNGGGSTHFIIDIAGYYFDRGTDRAAVDNAHGREFVGI